MKHFGVAARARRFDAGSRYGGHGGHSLALGFPELAHQIPGYAVSCTVQRPELGDGLVGLSKVEVENPNLWETNRVLPGGPKQVRFFGTIFGMVERLKPFGCKQALFCKPGRSLDAFKTQSSVFFGSLMVLFDGDKKKQVRDRSELFYVALALEREADWRVSEQE